MKTIYRYPIQLGDNTINTYENYQILSTDLDPRGDMSIWVLVDTSENKDEKLNVVVTGTGYDFPHMKNPCFIGTVRDGAYMWHVFYENI